MTEGQFAGLLFFVIVIGGLILVKHLYDRGTSQ